MKSGHIIWTITKTHCLVYNFLPSISAAIGDSETARSIWRILIFVHILPRYITCVAYLNFFFHSPYSSTNSFLFTLVTVSTAAFNFFELNSLLLLTVFTSNEHHGLHVFGFSSFQICALIYMSCHVLLFKRSGRSLSGRLARHSYKFKHKCLFATVLLLGLCTYFYYRHNKYCEPFVFSAFAFFEYLLVVANVLFHSTIRFDLRGMSLVFG
ncbi:hypothetical protein L596_023346 [Steinernema carpocapsae]|uniref:CWH43-like N-terminal domain-containing protein n=1 Tax=Steinernema carpocapsae TaxID=34508 RepID=A0A4U5MDD0_STECR|nr:hypothetical protein L596_023346 [Steinernema carpocapsae]